VIDQVSIMLTLKDEVELAAGSWTRWQEAVVQLLEEDFQVGLDEVDWVSWRAYYEEGRSPKAAIDRALERDY
jgi:hypothetical protein